MTQPKDEELHPMFNQPIRYHYYTFAFTSNGIAASSIVALEHNLVPLSAIDCARRANDMPEGSTLISVSYLGYMSAKEFDPEGQVKWKDEGDKP